jgi:hypothetical protein
MKKYFLIPQPPLTRQVSFLVDDISHKSNWGRTTDSDKVEYNFNLIDINFKLDLELQTAFVKKGLSKVLPLGRFITIITANKEFTNVDMTFFDFDIPADKAELSNKLLELYTENIVISWFETQRFLESNFSDKYDTVALLKPNES